MNPDTILAELRKREDTCWQMAGVFLDQRDFHGLHDMGVEIAALRRAAKEMRKLCQQERSVAEFAYTAPMGIYPEYVNITESYEGDLLITVRGPKRAGDADASFVLPGVVATMRLPRAERARMVQALQPSATT